MGRRRKGPFVAVNCAAVVETLLEAELFGIEERTATGVRGRRGKFEHADGGTLFLDEVSDLALAAQAKLLRAIQDLAIERVGGTGARRVDTRIVVATNRPLSTLVERGLFRPDLYYRLSGVDIQVPPLRERREDIPLLIEQFTSTASQRTGRAVSISPEAVRALTAYRWPGNVRELENTIERLVVFSRGRIEVQDLPESVLAAPPLEERLFADLPTLDELERRYLVHVLGAVGGNRSRAAEALGIDRRTLYRMAERFGIDLNEES